MTSNELRIGNMVYKSLKSGQGRTVINPIGCQDIVRIFEDIGSFNYAPIPLTEDILLKCGFVKVDDFFVLKIIDYGELAIESYFSIFIGNDGRDLGFCTNANICNHLHQLQNLYFALTQEELTIKL